MQTGESSDAESSTNLMVTDEAPALPKAPDSGGSLPRVVTHTPVTATPPNGGGGATEPSNSLDQQLSAVQSDAPFCDVCGHITIRNGACYKCLNCGNSMGCS